MNKIIVFKEIYNKQYRFLYNVDYDNHLREVEFGKPYILKSISVEKRRSEMTPTTRKQIECIIINFYDIKNNMTLCKLESTKSYFDDYFEYELI